MMTAAEAEKIKAALLVESSHLRRKGPSTHSLTCDCFFLKALDAVIALQAEITELKTPSGYATVDGEPYQYENGESLVPVRSFAELERAATQYLLDDGEQFKTRPYRAMPEETYIVRWVPDEEDPDMRRVRLERAEQSQHPIGDLREEEE